MTRTERTYYAVAGGYFLAQFFLAPVYPLFLLSRGLDLFEINVVLAVYLLVTFAFEVPTGAVADRFGRKLSFVLACAVRTFAFLLYTRTRSLGDCLVAEVIDGIGTTLASGALEAWAVDGVRAEGGRTATDRMFARAEVIRRLAVIGGGIACGYLAERDWNLPWFAAAALFTATGIVAMRAMDDGRAPAHPTGARPSVRATAATAIAAVATTPPLLVICALTLAGSFAVFPVWHYWQARLEPLTGEGPWLMGWILAALNLAGLAGSAVLPRLLGRFGRAPVLAGAFAWRGVVLALAASATRVSLVVGGLVLQEVASGLVEPVLLAWTNEHVGAAGRATVLSIRSAFLTFGGAAGLIVLGLVARAHGIPAAWGLSALVLLVAAPGYLLLGRAATLAVPPLAIEIPPATSKASTPLA